jgi:sucrose-6-phosphate hydrolase SacC (GH32 family)
MRQEGWLNDPNGLIWANGEYHLFAQRWNKCWIHAVSKDLIHWTELQPAFWEDHSYGTGVQSGGAVLDTENSSGLGSDPAHPPMVAFWSGNDNNSQCISYSLDFGRTWTKYANNPVLVHPERDPKVFKYKDGRWILVLYGDGKYHLFESANLLNWKSMNSSIPECFECPDLFELPIAGAPGESRWVLVRGNGNYSIGHFDGHSFTAEVDQIPCDFGPNFYATQSWGDIGGAPGRRVQIAWMRGGSYPEMPFNQQMTFPCDLTLRRTSEGLRLLRNPIPEITKLQGASGKPQTVSLAKGQTHSIDLHGGLYHFKSTVSFAPNSHLRLHVNGAALEITPTQVTVGDAHSAPIAIKSLEVVVDRTSAEVFLNGGERSFSACFVPTGGGLSIECVAGGATFEGLEVHTLKSAWKRH